MKEDSAMNTLVPSPASQEITRSRRIGVVIYPDCDIVDVCGPCDAFHYAEITLRRFGRINEPGYLCNILAATPGPVRTSCGIELVATHGYCDVKGRSGYLGRGGWHGCRAGQQRFVPRRMGGFDGAAGAAGGVDLYRRIHLGGGGPLASSARDDALVVFRTPRDGLPVD